MNAKPLSTLFIQDNLIWFVEETSAVFDDLFSQPTTLDLDDLWHNDNPDTLMAYLDAFLQQKDDMGSNNRSAGGKKNCHATPCHRTQ